MPRIRTIKPEWLDDEKLGQLSSDARVLSVALILLADDYGNGRANELMLAGRVFTFCETPSRVSREALAELSRVGFVSLYEVRGQKYYNVVNWAKHQKVDKPSKPQVPGPQDAENIGLLQGSRDTREEVARHSRGSRT